jgi:two-component system chemotaxis response regulator CheB
MSIDLDVVPPVVAIGGSAGSVPPLTELIAALPADFPATVLVTIHVGETSQLSSVLGRAARLPTSTARGGERLAPGRIVVAPPGSHLLVPHGEVRLSTGPRVNRHRPAVDVMFASVAKWVGARAVGVILSGTLDDGALGCALMERAGGRILVQSPTDSDFAGMPRSALRAAPGAASVGRGQLASKVIETVATTSQSSPPAYDAQAAAGRSTMAELSTAEPTLDMAEGSNLAYLATDETRVLRLACPECGGGMAQIDLPTISYFRCHVGHQYSPQSLLLAQVEAAEAKLWSAVAALEEQAATARFLGAMNDGPDAPDPDDTMRRAREVAKHARALRRPPSNGGEATEQAEG